MKKILLIEDDGAITRDLIKEFKSHGHEVKFAYSYVSAIDRWKDYKGGFDCIILDLNISPDGVDDENFNKYFPIIGILFLNNICEGKAPEEMEQIWRKTIVYSGYVDKLREKKNDFPYYNLLTLLPKKGTNFFELLTKVNEIVNSIDHTPKGGGLR